MRLSLKPHSGVAYPCARPSGLRARLRCRFVGVDGVKAAAAIVQRRGMPITAFVGANGGGKSAAAVYDVLPTLAGIPWECENVGHFHRHDHECPFWVLAGSASCTCDLPGPTTGLRRVVSTVLLWDPDTEVPYTAPHPLFDPLRRFRDLVRVEHADVILDEVTGVASSRQHASLPVQIENLINQLRRREIRLAWTCPDFSAADVRMRQVTQAVVYARGYLKVAAPSAGRQWRDSQLFRWSVYDASAFDEFNAGKRAKLAPEAVQFFWRPGHLVNRVYDTQAPVIALGVATEGGMCMHCGGRRSLSKCSCPPDADALGSDVVEDVKPSGARTRRVVRLAAPTSPPAESDHDAGEDAGRNRDGQWHPVEQSPDDVPRDRVGQP